MRYSKLCGENVSRLGFGTMRLPLTNDDKIDFTKASEMIDYAFKNGINYYDTAYMYHSGRAELFCRDALVSRYPRKDFFLADKMPTWLCKIDSDAPRIFEKQLSKSGVDFFDFYLIHSVDEGSWPNILQLNIAEYLFQEKKCGRIHHLGISVHCNPPLLTEILQTYGDILEFVQIQLNYMDWEFQNAKELYAICEEWGKPIVVMEPLRGGMLANPMSEDARSVLDAAKNGRNLSYSDFGFGFVDSLENVACVLSGMSSSVQLSDNIRFFSGDPLTEEQKKAVYEASKKLKSDILVPCTGCNYCFECPQDIKIPKIFSLYNEAAAKGFNWLWGSLTEEYLALGPNANQCISCGSCESHCPQKINIIETLKKIDEKYNELRNSGK